LIFSISHNHHKHHPVFMIFPTFPTGFSVLWNQNSWPEELTYTSSCMHNSSLVTNWSNRSGYNHLHWLWKRKASSISWEDSSMKYSKTSYTQHYTIIPTHKMFKWINFPPDFNIQFILALKNTLVQWNEILTEFYKPYIPIINIHSIYIKLSMNLRTLNKRFLQEKQNDQAWISVYININLLVTLSNAKSLSVKFIICLQ